MKEEHFDSMFVMQKIGMATLSKKYRVSVCSLNKKERSNQDGGRGIACVNALV